jgi:hypothetical protein
MYQDGFPADHRRVARPQDAQSRPGKRRLKKKAKPRLKAFWGVYDDLLRQAALFDYTEKQKAEERARQMTGSGKGSYFAKLVKAPVE